MYTTEEKTSTLRQAWASGELRAKPETIQAVKDGRVPKGNVIEMARCAGVMAAKRTWEMIPYCHPISLDQALMEFEYHEDKLVVRATVTLVGKTGPEMEALAAVSLALLTLYDMLKPLDKGMSMEAIRLDKKRGGKSTFKDRPKPGLRFWLLTVSDSTAKGDREDKSGDLVEQMMRDHGLEHERRVCLPDERDQIQSLVKEAIAQGVDLLVSTGGTGLGPRDVTVEAIHPLIEREIPGIAEAMRRHGQDRTPYAMLSRGVAGLAGNTMILTLPGSSKGVRQSLKALLPGLFHLWPMMRGAGHDAEGQALKDV